MKRKTIDVEWLLNKANIFLASDDTTPDGREAVISIIETVLFETGNYNGFRYLDPVEGKPWEVKGKGSRREYFS